MGPMAGEQCGLSLVYAILEDVAQSCRGIRIDPVAPARVEAQWREVVPL